MKEWLVEREREREKRERGNERERERENFKKKLGFLSPFPPSLYSP